MHVNHECAAAAAATAAAADKRSHAHVFGNRAGVHCGDATAAATGTTASPTAAAIGDSGGTTLAMCAAISAGCSAHVLFCFFVFAPVCVLAVQVPSVVQAPSGDEMQCPCCLRRKNPSSLGNYYGSTVKVCNGACSLVVARLCCLPTHGWLQHPHVTPTTRVRSLLSPVPSACDGKQVQRQRLSPSPHAPHVASCSWYARTCMWGLWVCSCMLCVSSHTQVYACVCVVCVCVCCMCVCVCFFLFV